MRKSSEDSKWENGVSSYAFMPGVDETILVRSASRGVYALMGKHARKAYAAPFVFCFLTRNRLISHNNGELPPT
jgi:hypothetical protein